MNIIKSIGKTLYRRCKCALFSAALLMSCNKLVQIPPPVNTITTSEVFADSSDATAAMLGIYTNVLYGPGGTFSFCNGSETILCGLSSDELVNFNTGIISEFYFNTLEAINGNVGFYLWTPAYTYIYQANACIEGITASSTLSPQVKSSLSGEAKFLRALFYFYLTNLFGDVPYVTSTAWKTTDTISNASQALIYQSIISDLKDARSSLRADYSLSGNQRTRANSYAAAALLARVYLYMGNWPGAEAEADTVLECSAYSLVSDLNAVFAPNSTESILQWQLNTSYFPYNLTPEDNSILPYDTTQPPQFYLSQQLLGAFEPGDSRFTSWTNISNYFGSTYTYPYKYKVMPSQTLVGGSATEYPTVLRLAEQFLIRAEARAQQGNLAGAAADLNMIRARANLGPTSAVTQGDMLAAIAHERQIEFFAEWGHRWLDLKRTGKVDSVMTIVTPQKDPGGSWKPYKKLYPVPQLELEKNPFLKQNPQY